MGRFPTQFVESTADLPKYLGDRGDKAVAKLASKGYVVKVGLTEEDALAIGQVAKQRSIRDYCPRDEKEARFANTDSTAKWLTKGEEDGEKGRAMFVLKRMGGSSLVLAGYGWTGPEVSRNEDRSIKIPGASITFAVRIGEADQNLGLGIPFTEVIVAGTEEIYGKQKSADQPEDIIWLETWESNKACGMYPRAGFEDLPHLAYGSGRTNADGEAVWDTRRFMAISHNNAAVSSIVRN